MEAAVKAGCTRFDGALKGIGGCPMAGEELVGNMNTELMISYLEETDGLSGPDKKSPAKKPSAGLRNIYLSLVFIHAICVIARSVFFMF